MKYVMKYEIMYDCIRDSGIKWRPENIQRRVLQREKYLGRTWTELQEAATNRQAWRDLVQGYITMVDEQEEED